MVGDTTTTNSTGQATHLAGLGSKVCCGHGLALSVASGAWIARLVFEPDRLEGPWFRDRSPRLPGEAVRWLSFRAAVGAMAVLDRVA